MAIDAGDPACLEALSVQIGHPAPFSDAEVARVTALTVTHARDLSLIRTCSALRHLRIVASELEDLGAVEGLTALAHIEVFCSLCKTLRGASSCDRLERFDVLFSSVEDASAVIGTTRTRGVLIGNPWNDLSWGALGADAMRGDVLVQLSSKYEWSVTRELWQRAGVCAGTLAGSYSLVVRPGLPKLTQNVYDALRIAPSLAVSDLTDPDVSVEGLFHERAAAVDAPDLADLLAQRTLGFADDALRWIEKSTLPPEDKADVARFVRRFAGLKFYRSSEALVARFARMYQLDPPRGYVAMTGILDGWLAPDDQPPVRFDRFESASLREDSGVTRPYSLALSNYTSGAEARAAVRAAGFVIIGRSAEHSSQLVMRTDGRDPRIYELDLEDIDEAIAEERDVAASIYPVFRSYAAMLGHIISVHPRGGAPIRASA
jgi:hypothetical protein